MTSYANFLLSVRMRLSGLLTSSTAWDRLRHWNMVASAPADEPAHFLAERACGFDHRPIQPEKKLLPTSQKSPHQLLSISCARHTAPQATRCLDLSDLSSAGSNDNRQDEFKTLSI